MSSTTVANDSSIIPSGYLHKVRNTHYKVPQIVNLRPSLLMRSRMTGVHNSHAVGNFDAVTDLAQPQRILHVMYEHFLKHFRTCVSRNRKTQKGTMASSQCLLIFEPVTPLPAVTPGDITRICTVGIHIIFPPWATKEVIRDINTYVHIYNETTSGMRDIFAMCYYVSFSQLQLKISYL